MKPSTNFAVTSDEWCDEPFGPVYRINEHGARVLSYVCRLPKGHEGLHNCGGAKDQGWVDGTAQCPSTTVRGDERLFCRQPAGHNGPHHTRLDGLVTEWRDDQIKPKGRSAAARAVFGGR